MSAASEYYRYWHEIYCEHYLIVLLQLEVGYPPDDLMLVVGGEEVTTTLRDNRVFQSGDIVNVVFRRLGRG